MGCEFVGRRGDAGYGNIFSIRSQPRYGGVISDPLPTGGGVRRVERIG